MTFGTINSCKKYALVAVGTVMAKLTINAAMGAPSTSAGSLSVVLAMSSRVFGGLFAAQLVRPNVEVSGSRKQAKLACGCPLD